MKLFCPVISLLLLSSCYKTIDSTNKVCTSGCTVIQGRVTTLNYQPVPDVTIKIRSVRNTSVASGVTRNIAEGKSGLPTYTDTAIYTPLTQMANLVFTF